MEKALLPGALAISAASFCENGCRVEIVDDEATTEQTAQNDFAS